MRNLIDYTNAASFRGDPILSFLRNTIHLSKSHCFLLLALGNLLWLLLGDALIWMGRGGNILLTFDPRITLGYYLSDPLIGTPLLAIGYIWSSDTFVQLLQGLLTEQTIHAQSNKNTAALRNLLQMIQKNSERQRWLWPSVALGACFCYWGYIFLWNQPSNLSQASTYPYWYLEKWYFWLIFFPRRIFTIYMISVLTLRYVRTSQDIKRLFKLDIFRVRPLHPDKVGGFGAVSRHIGESIMMVAVLGTSISVFAWYLFSIGGRPWPDSRLVTGLGFYSMLLPLLWFNVILAARKRMIAEKKKLLTPLSYIFQAKVDSNSRIIMKNMNLSPRLKVEMHNLSEIRSQYEMIDETFPNWPLRPSIIRGLSLAALLPYISTGASILSSFL